MAESQADKTEGRARDRARASWESKLTLSAGIRNEELHDWSDLRRS